MNPDTLNPDTNPDTLNPDTLNPDPNPDKMNLDLNPDPAFKVNPDLIRIQGFEDQKLKKKTAEIFYISFYVQKLQFTVLL